MVGSVKIGAYGGYGAPGSSSENKDLNVPPLALYTITVRAPNKDNGISAISFVYKATDGTIVTVGPWGTTSSGNDNQISIKEGEYVIQVSGTYGTAVNSLEITTNFTKYKYGKDDGTYFSVPVKNGKIVGFFGNTGPDGLNALGVYVIPRE